MRVLAFDSGAENLGWASVGREGSSPYYHLSGVLHLHKNESGLTFQNYRLELTRELNNSIPALIELTDPEQIVTEIIPPVGFNNPVQSYLANVAATVIHVVALDYGLPIYQIGATTVHKRIAIGVKGRKVTKVQVRNGVFRLLPELEDRKKEWTKRFDEPDAIAIALSHLGFQNS
jgi:Holliday junction resolvasome RuvABC endonuclease subunit